VPITIGETHTLASKPLAQERTVNVYLPADYATSGKTYSVLYLIDGGMDQDFLHITGTSALGALWARSQELIVVGVATKDRRRELTGPTQDAALLKEFPTAGGSAAFRAFIRDEVMPMVSQTYRTSGETAVIGESLAGLFIVETYLTEPDLFDHYAAISPSLWWDDERLSRCKILIANRGEIACRVAAIRTAPQDGHQDRRGLFRCRRARAACRDGG
jgi:predicted alpha/beta superfamily hydrolase